MSLPAKGTLEVLFACMIRIVPGMYLSCLATEAEHRRTNRAVVGFGDRAVHLAGGLASCSDELRQTKLDMELVTTAVLAGYL